MKTTDGFTCSATATNASWKSPADLRAGAESCGTAGAASDEGGGTTSVSAAPLFFGRLRVDARSEEHTSELQSPCNLVCRLLLEKKKQFNTQETISAVVDDTSLFLLNGSLVTLLLLGQ